jgi:hypothetical protein|tara:strand:+ start:871 stop:1977 length:1107 start_codon:yes stop_codon:yes gene_type:complete
MSTTYLILANRVLRELNEVEMTSANFASSRGIQTAVKDFVNKSVHDIYNESVELPLLHTTTTQATYTGDGEYAFPSDMRRVDFESFFLKPNELLTNGEFTSNITSWTTIAGAGSAAYNSGGNGRLRLNDYAAYQSVSTVVNKTYNLQVRVLDSEGTGQALKVQVGTAAEGTQNLNTTLTVSDFNSGKVLDVQFTATDQTTFITLNNTSTGTNLDVDYVRLSRADITTRKLQPISYDDYMQRFKEQDSQNNSGHYGIPQYVYRKPDYSSFGLTPIPDKNDYLISYEYFTTHTDLSAHGDVMGLPDRFGPLLVDRCRYYTYMLRSDAQHAQLADSDYKRKLRLLKNDYTSRSDYMRDTRVSSGNSNLSII